LARNKFKKICSGWWNWTFRLGECRCFKRQAV